MTSHPDRRPELGVLRPVRSPRTADLVAAQLRRRIVGEMQDGETLPPESVLMERLDVARQTLREAYRVLETEGLLTVRRGVHGGATTAAFRAATVPSGRCTTWLRRRSPNSAMLAGVVEHMFAAAASSVAELVFLDLEDATAPSQKEASRAKERNVAVCREAEARGLRAVGAAVVLVDAAHVKAAETTLARAALIDPTRLAPVR